jgi:nucleoside 2-deoxyribosyltransferase
VSTRRLRCFVASRFGAADVDAVFDRCIRPTLKAESIVVRRVDRQHRNDDLDDQIIDLIEWCDFCIADLTYARPSVYFEAGMVTGLEKPVVYMARGDHFKARDEDSLGNERVHFDLQMKPIIAWTSPEALTLKKKLAARVRRISRPIRANIQSENAARAAEMAFAGESAKKRVDRMWLLLQASAKAAGFVGQADRGQFAFERQTPRGNQGLLVWASQSLPKSRMELLHEWPGFRGETWVSFDLVMASLRPAVRSSVSDVFAAFRMAEPGIYRRDSGRGSDIVTAVHLLCPRSYADLDKLLEYHFARVGLPSRK